MSSTYSGPSSVSPSIPRQRPRAAAAALLLALAAAAGFSAGAQPREARGEARLPLRLVATGSAAADLGDRPLEPEDLELVIGGETRLIEALTPPGEAEPWRLVVVFDALASADEKRRAALLLGEQAAELTALGEVEIVRLDPAPRVVLPPSRDPTIVESSFNQASLAAGEGDALRALRRRYYQRLLHLRQRRDADPTGDEAIADLVAQAVSDEAALIARQQDALLAWLAERDADPARRALLLVSGGWDQEARRFYLEQLPDDLRGGAAAAAAVRPLERATVEWANGVAALGWLGVPLRLDASAELEPSEQALAYDRQREASADRGAGDSPAPNAWQTTSLRKIRRQLLGEEGSAEPQGPLLLAPETPLEELAAATGGRLVARREELPPLLSSLASTHVLGYRQREDDAGAALEVRSRRPGVEARTPRIGLSAAPTALTAARARRLLAGEPPAGELRVAAALRAGSSAGEATIEARADLTPIAESRAAAAGDGVLERPVAVRLTVARGADGEPLGLAFETRTVDDPTAPFAAELPLAAASEAGSDRVAVLVETLAGDGWGGALAADLGPADQAPAEAALEPEELDALSEAVFLPKDKPVRLLPPSAEVLRGKVRVQALASSDEVAQVDFYLDGERVERSRKPPFEARLRLGNLPRPRTLRVVAFDAEGRELGDDTLALNDLGRGFRARIVEPQPGRRVGAVEVLVDLAVPVDRRLDRLELSWNERRVATLYGPPFRHRLVIPADDPQGFIRAVAHLDDGRSAEDVVFMNERDFADRVQIRLVELYTVVTDRDGRPVAGLTADRFTVREEGEVQEIAGFDDAGDLPLTLGLTIDSSASMFVKLPVVQQAAGDFVRGFLSGRDRAFLVDFDTEPRMVRAMTSDLHRVVDGIESLEADGDTHLWESIVYSLMELQGASGKKALVVFSDGAEEEEALSFKTCQRFAQRLGIPIYLIVLHPGIARGDDLTASVKSFTRKLERLTADTGGRVYFIPNTDGLDAIYQQIDRELRSQYLLTYYSTARSEGDEDWRRVEVEVEGKGLEARTITGYFPVD